MSEWNIEGEYEFNRIRSAYEWQKEQGFFAKDGEPLKCFGSNCTDSKVKIEDVSTIEGQVLEQYAVCESCNTVLGSCAYGQWIEPY